MSEPYSKISTNQIKCINFNENKKKIIYIVEM